MYFSYKWHSVDVLMLFMLYRTVWQLIKHDATFFYFYYAIKAYCTFSSALLMPLFYTVVIRLLYFKHLKF